MEWFKNLCFIFAAVSNSEANICLHSVFFGVFSLKHNPSSGIIDLNRSNLIHCLETLTYDFFFHVVKLCFLITLIYLLICYTLYKIILDKNMGATSNKSSRENSFPCTSLYPLSYFSLKIHVPRLLKLIIFCSYIINQQFSLIH